MEKAFETIHKPQTNKNELMPKSRYGSTGQHHPSGGSRRGQSPSSRYVTGSKGMTKGRWALEGWEARMITPGMDRPEACIWSVSI